MRTPRLALCAAALVLVASAAPAATGRLIVDLSPTGLRNTIRTEQALGAGIDGSWRGGVDRLLTPGNVAAMSSAGLAPLTYRLRTELGIAAWHWNPVGAWSDPGRQQGYWTSSDRPGAPIQTSWGYDLPRRGDTLDMANNTRWSMLDDGDPATFWKSNPYLDPRYSHATARPQWFILELGERQVVDTAQIAWGEPYATRYKVQYWTGADEYDAHGRWETFPHGEVRDGHGGTARLDLGPSARPTAFVRVFMAQGSDTAPAGADDPRDRIGVAVREAGFGRRGPDGAFVDAVRHAASHDGQSIAHVSSTDPWHRASDKNLDLEQAGLDRVFASGLTHGLPVMVPVGVLYDAPENAAAEIRYLRARHYPIARVELGEEPDGQYVDGEDYGALYLETVDLLHAIDRRLVLGGPSLQSGLSDTWLDPDPDRSWNSHFIRYLKARHRLADLGFFSFEHYPFDDICGDIYGKLVAQSGLMARLMDRVRKEGVPTTIPWHIAEYGFSAFSGRAEAELPSALLMANIAGQFLTAGGDGAYLFGYGPNEPVNQHQPCAGYGNLMLFTADEAGQAVASTPTFQTARLLTGAWLQPTGPHRLYAARVDTGDPRDADAVKAFVALRPDGRLGVMIVNRDPKRAFTLYLAAGRALLGPAELWSYSAAQYEWIDAGPQSHPGRNLPPAHVSQPAFDGRIEVLPASLTVVVVRAR
ncbi:discoidin domain-containing protein [Phenylobacterium sp.]|uniref:discoidin domain-containing protein n=1 Tax=Phenylobacterium sp. TaxID=1871053 RepID=UPI0025E7C025|nr:discoidin domain-containing protein [Phenylobacterium sp.]